MSIVTCLKNNYTYNSYFCTHRTMKANEGEPHIRILIIITIIFALDETGRLHSIQRAEIIIILGDTYI